MTGWTTTRTSADYTPAVAIYPDGRTRPCSVQAVRRKLESGIVAWVRREDVERVRDGESNG